MSQYQPTYDSFQRDPHERYVPTSRIGVAASVQLPGSEVDPYTGQLKPERVRRHRTQAQRLEQERLQDEDRKLRESLTREMKKGGVRVTWLTALVLCSVLIFGSLFTIGYQRSVIAGYQDQQNEIAKEKAYCVERNAELTAAVETAQDISTIGYAARNLGLIRAEGVEAVYLTAVDTRPMKTAKKQPAVQTIEATAQSTHVPVVASAGN